MTIEDYREHHTRQLAREAARRRDAELVGVIASIAGESCPFPVSVLVDDTYRLHVRAGRTILVTVDRDLVEARSELELVESLGAMTAAAYLDLDTPIPDNVILGQE